MMKKCILYIKIEKMMRRFASIAKSAGNKLEGLYNNRRGIATGAHNIFGTAKQGIRLLGRANASVRKSE